MDWLAENWFFVIVAIILLFTIFGGSKNQQQKKRKRTVVDSISSGQYSSDRQMMDRIVVAIGDVIEKVTGSTYTKTQRIKIATGMIALMHYNKITPEQFFEPKIFVRLMIDSIKILEKESML